MHGALKTLASVSAIWLQFVFAAALLLIGHLALTTKRFLMTEAGKLKSDEESFNGLLLSESALRRDWDTPEEDAAWANL